MTQSVRRVVTGLDPQGQSCILFDGPSGMVVWTSDRSPADNSSNADAGDAPFTFDISEGGTLMATIAFAPDGTTGPMGMHATDTLDYAVITSGEITLITETGETLLRAGDVVVDRGILHAWRNDGPEPCRAVFIFVKADPVGKGATL